MNFYPVGGCSSPDERQIENSVRENGGILRSFGYGFAIPDSSPEIVGNWKIMLTDQRGMGNHGSFIAVATTKEAFLIQKQATMRLLREEADAMEARAKLSDDEGLPYASAAADEDSENYFCRQNCLELAARRSFREQGDFACKVVPLLSSPEFKRKGYFLFADGKWAYFAHSHANYLRVGDGRHRLWVRPVGRRSK